MVDEFVQGYCDLVAGVHRFDLGHALVEVALAEDDDVRRTRPVRGLHRALEATPAEGTTYRFAKEDKKRWPQILQAGSADKPYYTNSSQLPVGHTDDPFEALAHQQMADALAKQGPGSLEKLLLSGMTWEVGADGVRH